MMNRKLVVASMALALLVPGLRGQGPPEEKPVAALVNIQELFREYYKTLEAESLINVERARIQKSSNEMREKVRLLDAEIEEVNQMLAAGRDLPDEKRQALIREAGLLFQEREQLERQRKGIVQSEHRDLNRRMVARMKGILREIRDIVAEQATRGGFDIVFDSAGLNSAQVPFVLYAKDATDLTPRILKELNKNAPPGQ